MRFPSGRNLLFLFGISILLPGLLLAVFGVWALRQERRFASQQLRDRLALAAGIAARELDREMSAWQALLEQTGRGETVALGELPDPVRAPFEDAGAGAIVFRGGDGPGLWPPQQALYDIRPDPVSRVNTAVALTQAETAELVKDYPTAVQLYRRELESAAPDLRPLVLQRLARTLRKAGRLAEAHATYRGLASSTVLIGRLPADLIARYEICSLLDAQNEPDLRAQAAFDLYRDLVAGRWALEKSRYMFYAARSREWASSSATLEGDLAAWTAIEARKRELIEAAAVIRDTPNVSAPGSVQEYVVLEADGRPAAALLLSRSWLSSHFWPRTFESLLAEGLDVVVVGPGGDVLFRTASAAGTTAIGAPALEGISDASRAPWRVRVSPRDPAAFSADVIRRQTLYLVMLILVLALLGFGTYFTARVVKRELEIARLKSEFVSTVSHEFRSPLTGIRQLGEMLARGRVPSDERRQEYYELITRESDRLSRLVENLLDFSRMEEGRREYDFALVDTGAWLHAVVDEARAQYAGRQMEIVPAIPESLPPLLADRTALASAVHNLIDNAVKYSPGRDTVWVEADARNSHVIIRVRDAGVGISDDERRHIFEKFYRGKGEITRQVNGAGLGLSLVEHIVRAHGGTVECAARPGEGTTFSIQLAAASEQAGT